MTLDKLIGKWSDTSIAKEFDKKYLKHINKYINYRRKKVTVYPENKDIFNALKYTDPEDVRCVVLGQDPYYNGSATGLAFANKLGTDISPSLKNIFTAVENSVGSVSTKQDLLHWADQGVLLLNTVLTVEEGEARSHRKIPTKKGKYPLWQKFTSTVLKYVVNNCQPFCIMLWGRDAQNQIFNWSKKGCLIDPFVHNISPLEAPHPSPLSAYRGFYNCDHFKMCNNFLRTHNIEEIDW